MKRVLREVLAAVELQPVERPRRAGPQSAISFSPGQNGLVIAGCRGDATALGMPVSRDLLIVGAGAKAAAIAAKVHVAQQPRARASSR